MRFFSTGFQRSHPIAKMRADLTGLLYADGIHDSLYRSAGLTLLYQPEPVAEPVPLRSDADPAPSHPAFDQAA